MLRSRGRRPSKEPLSTTWFRAEPVPAERYVTQQEAAQRLRCSLSTVAALLEANGRLRAVTYDDMPLGVDVLSIEEELKRRSRRFWRLRAFISALVKNI